MTTSSSIAARATRAITSRRASAARARAKGRRVAARGSRERREAAPSITASMFAGRAARLLALAVAVPALAGAVADGARAADAFDGVWRDGRAEVSGYRLRVERYGHPRVGRAVLITVTEPFSRSRHVKLDDANARGSDVLD